MRAPFRLPRVATTCSPERISNRRSSSSRRSAAANTRRARCIAYRPAVTPPMRASWVLRDRREVRTQPLVGRPDRPARRRATRPAAAETTTRTRTRTRSAGHRRATPSRRVDLGGFVMRLVLVRWRRRGTAAARCAGTDGPFEPGRAGCHNRRVHIDKLRNTTGFVVVDLDDAPTSVGIVRVAPKVLQGSATALARTATYTFAARELQVGGASAGISTDPEQRAEAVAAFADEVRERVDAGT